VRIEAAQTTASLRRIEIAVEHRAIDQAL